MKLNTLIRQAIDEHPDAGPRELAEVVAKLTDAEDVLRFYTEALVPVVRELLREQRNAALSNVANNKEAAPAPSAKLRDRRTWWQRMLAARIHVGNGVWKQLGDCTIGDLQHCVAERENEITALRVTVDRYRRLIDVMAAHGATTVGDLPEQESL